MDLLSLPTTRTRHVGNDLEVERYDQDLWTDEFAFLNRPDIQSDLFYDYRTNVDSYRRSISGAEAYRPLQRRVGPLFRRLWRISWQRSRHKGISCARRPCLRILFVGKSLCGLTAQPGNKTVALFAVGMAADEVAALIRGSIGS